jgi:SecD/SecF fusion protein
MKSFYLKLAICVIPCLLAAWATFDATFKYYRGDPGGFKLGVDLVGGTILVYEIDLAKSREADKDKTFDPIKVIAVLAESLKKRIDPNDLYNITIRPAGGEGRIEIILPTGGTHRTKKAEKDWASLIEHLDEYFQLAGAKKIAVGRGKVLELADQIQTITSESLWDKKLFGTPESWERLKSSALKYWASIDLDIKGDELKKIPPNVELGKEFANLKVTDADRLDKFSAFVLKATAKSTNPTTKKTIQSWLKKQAWDETLTQVRRKWFPVKTWSADAEYVEGSFVRHGDNIYASTNKFKGKLGQPPGESWNLVEPEQEPYGDDMSRITPDSNEQVTTFVLAKGSVIAQAAIALVQPLVGNELKRVFVEDNDPTADEVRTFLKDHYGPPVTEILAEINKKMSETGLGKDLSVEEVQRIKDLVSKVGSLEFRILANSDDDKAAIEDCALVINSAGANPDVLKEIEAAQQKGLPPPVKREMRQDELKSKKYTIVTAKGVKSTVTYSWVELGPTERKSLNLDNAARTDATRNVAWSYAAVKRNQAEKLPQSGGTERFLLQGSLFYSRECKDRNLPEEERRKKEVEYFILTRDPEFEDENRETRTPKIDGSYLVSAYGAPGHDLRPTVHFTFNVQGGNLFGNITRKNVSEEGGPAGTQKRRHLAIILDGLVMSAPTINSEIRTQGQISGNFTQKEVDSLVNILRAGQLPATLKPQPVSESTIAATLGEDTIAAGVRSIVFGFLAILVFMIIYYRFAGLVAAIALLANLLLTVGFMVAVQATFTLSGLAGLVLTLGMAIDANVLIYERLREERERGGSILQALRNGYDRALPTILDSHVTTILTAVILFIVGNDNLKGFAVSSIVGLVFSLFTSIVMTRFIFDYWQEKGWLTKLTMMRLFAKPDIDFMGIRTAVFSVTAVLAIGGVALFIGRIPNDLGIDFVGGTAYGGKLTMGKKIDDLRPKFSDKNQLAVLGGVTAKELDESMRRYELVFPNGDKKPRTVSLNNQPLDGRGTKEEREADVSKRASLLPEPSVDLLFNSTTLKEIKDEIGRGESRNFVIRTTEREPEIVQACADQLLRDDNGNPMLSKVYARYDAFEKGETRFHFYKTEAETKLKDGKPNPESAYASQSFFKSLLNRELRRAYELKSDKDALPFVLEVTAEGNSDADGKFPVMKVTMEPPPADPNDPRAKKAFEETVQSFADRPLPDRLENFDSALANETRFRAMWAILASWAGILLYLWFRFGSWTFGLAAVTCVIHDVFLTLGFIAAAYFVHDTFIGSWLMLEDFKLDLTAVASLLTLVGYSVNDKIVVFDRIREVRGKNPDLTPKMINDSINQTLSRTVLTSMTIAVVFLLYVFGGPGLHLFAFIMMIGVIIGTFSSIYIASPLLLMFGEGKHEDATAPGAPKPVAAGIPEGAFKAAEEG